MIIVLAQLKGLLKYPKALCVVNCLAPKHIAFMFKKCHYYQENIKVIMLCCDTCK